MARSPFSPALALLLACCFLAPSKAGAVVFLPYWQLRGWTFVKDLGNIDSDPQDELLFKSKVDGHLAILDGLTGAITVEFPEFKADEVIPIIQNIDADPKPEIILSRVPPFSGPYVPLTRVYKLGPGGFTAIFSHTDPIRDLSLVHLRSAGQMEFLERSDNDVRVRDMNGTVLLRASTAVATWTGVQPSLWLGDLDGDGIDELGVTQNTSSINVQTWFFHYNGSSFVYTWSSTSWFMEDARQTDGDAHGEVQAFNWIDGRYAYFDGVSGTTDLELPEFTLYNNSSVFAVDVDGDGRQEIFASRPAGPGITPLVRAYKWVAGNYVQMFTHTQEPLSGQLLHTRNATQLEFLDATSGDFVLRDAVAGTVLFRASTQIPGWSGASPIVAPADFDKDGVAELIIQDGATPRVVRYSGGAYTPLWSSTAWKYPSQAPKLDDQPLDGLFAVATSDGHWGLLDPFTGAVRQEFPTFLSSVSSPVPVDFDHGSRKSLMMIRNGFSVTPLTTCYRWNGSSFATLFSHTDEYNGVVAGPYRTKSYNDLLEVATVNGENHDIRVRAFDGSVVFNTANSLPGWNSIGVSGSLDTMDVDHDGLVEFMATDSALVRLMHYIGPVGVTDLHDGPALRLAGGSPNPFHASTTLRFSIRNAGDVGIAIYDASGRVVRRLDQRLPAGNHEVKWDGRDQAGHAVPNGVLFYEVRAAGMRESRKLVRIGR